MFFAGVDVGSVAAKALILQDREIIASAIEPNRLESQGCGA